jgi:predicted nucleic acid-binding protein
MARIKSKTSVICDAGPIIHLDELGCLHLLSDFEKVLLPNGVRREVLKHRKSAFETKDVSWERASAKLPLEEPLRTMCKIFSLDAGEVEALAVLREQPGVILLTDDAAARLVATRLGFRAHGTIGILIRAMRRDLMKSRDVLDVLNRIPSQSSLHIKLSLLQEVISILRQEFNQ